MPPIPQATSPEPSDVAKPELGLRGDCAAAMTLQHPQPDFWQGRKSFSRAQLTIVTHMLQLRRMCPPSADNTSTCLLPPLFLILHPGAPVLVGWCPFPPVSCLHHPTGGQLRTAQPVIHAHPGVPAPGVQAGRHVGRLAGACACALKLLCPLAAARRPLAANAAHNSQSVLLTTAKCACTLAWA